ncbi:hypothetical protein SEA_JACKO_25 [Microbacterium phage Jacko]|nr:hypothetical protein SEA_JACKO_25 [Microbacterium phage Jacko]
MSEDIKKVSALRIAIMPLGDNDEPLEKFGSRFDLVAKRDLRAPMIADLFGAAARDVAMYALENYEISDTYPGLEEEV